MKAIATFSIFASAEAMVEGKEVVTNEDVDVTHLFPDIQSMIYAEGKKTPKFKDSKDV